MIRVGPAGWSYPDWEGIVYPRPKPRSFDPLAYLARQFDAIEINSSFYSLPRRETTTTWARRVEDAPSFRFTAKLHQSFTHGEDDFARLQPDIQAFRDGVQPLVDAGRLGGLLAQFPLRFQFGARELRRIDELRCRFDPSPLIVEVRHRSWFEPAALREFAALAGVSLAAIDLPPAADHPPDAHATPGPIGYLRLHGRNCAAWFSRSAGRDQKYDYIYGDDELVAIASRARSLAADARPTYVITNNHFEGKAVANAMELVAALNRRQASAPESLRRRYPQLAKSTRPEGQQQLF